MSCRYTVEQLLILKDSPLVKKPDNLPPSEEWMGPVPDSSTRAQGRREPSDRHGKNQETPLLDQTNRRLTADRHSRGSNTDDIVLGPPKTAFASSTSIRNNNKSIDTAERAAKENETGRRFALHSKLGDLENDRGPARDGRRLRRSDADRDQDGEGWSTVKPRKSFGAEGAERMFNGRMGGEARHKDDRRTRDNHDKDHKDRPARGFDNYSRDKDVDHDHEEPPRRNGVGRGRNEPSWFKDKDDPSASSGRNGHGNRQVDSNRGWREKDRDDGEKGGERGERGERGEKGDRRWNRDKDQRQERDPEWMAETEDEKKNTHTMEDFEKWKKSMKASNGDTPAAEDGPAKDVQPSNGFEPGSFFGAESAKVDTPLGIDTGPDQFFGQWAAEKRDKGFGDALQDESIVKVQTAGKASRFKSFFAAPSPEESMRRVTEPTPTRESASKGDFQGLFGGNKTESTSEDKEAFAALLQKLHSQTIGPPHSTPPANTNQPPPPMNHEARPQSATAQQMPGLFNQYQAERQDEHRHSSRNSQQHLIDLLNPKSPMHSQYSNQPTNHRPEQMVQEIMNHRQNAPNQPSGRSEQSNSEFMLRLMQGQQAPGQQGIIIPRRESQNINVERQLRERLAMELEAQRASQQQQHQHFDREQREQREQRDRRLLQAQRQARKQQELSQGFYEEQMMQPSYPQQIEQRNIRPQQPTQILQRPPPGLDNIMPQNWGAPGPPSNQLPHQLPHRLVQPPPGLSSVPGGMMPLNMQQNMQNMNQNMQIPPSGFPPGFLPGMAGGFEGPNGVMQRGGPGPMLPLPPPGLFALPGFLTPQQQQQTRGLPGHGGYEAMNGGAGAAYLQSQLIDSRQQGPGQGQQGPYRR